MRKATHGAATMAALFPLVAWSQGYACGLDVVPDSVVWDGGGNLPALRNEGGSSCRLDSLRVSSSFFRLARTINIFDSAGGMVAQATLDPASQGKREADGGEVFTARYSGVAGLTIEPGKRLVLGSHFFGPDTTLPNVYDSLAWIDYRFEIFSGGKSYRLVYRMNRKSENIFKVARRIPRMVEATALDNGEALAGIDGDDQVLLRFDGPFWEVLDPIFMDQTFPISGGHSWKSGFNRVGRVERSPDSSLVLVTLNVQVSPPTLAVGDTIRFAASGSSAVLGGSFDPPTAVRASFPGAIRIGKGTGPTLQGPDVLGRRFEAPGRNWRNLEAEPGE